MEIVVVACGMCMLVRVWHCHGSLPGVITMSYRIVSELETTINQAFLVSSS